MRQLTLLLMTVSLLVGGVPQKISYQGYVTHADGSLVSDGPYNVIFRLYEASEGGDALWEESQYLTISSGLISAILGNTNPLNFSQNMHFLEIEIGTPYISNEVLTPRQELTTVFYAFHAESASTATKATLADTALYARTIANPTSSINNLSDALIETNSMYLGNDPSATTSTAEYNVGVGVDAMNAITTGDKNTAIGYKAGDTGTNDITTGDQNVLVGANTAASSATASNQIVIGSGATGHGDNIAVMGNGSLTAIHPSDDNEVDLGSSSYEYKDLYLDGTAHMDGISIHDGFAGRLFWSYDGLSDTEVTIIPDGDGDVKYYLSFDISVLSWTGSELTIDSRVGGNTTGGILVGRTSTLTYTGENDGITLTLNSDGSLTAKRYGSSSYNWKLVAMFKWM